MGFIMGVKRTDFYNELSEEKRKEYLSIKTMKFMPCIDNLYYSVFISGDSKENKDIEVLIERLRELKLLVQANHEAADYAFGLQMTLKSYSVYRLCLTEPDLYDIFILGGKLPTDNTPRIVVQIRSMGLWTFDVVKILRDSFDKTAMILSDYDFEIDRCRENRIDYCYHTNAVASPAKVFAKNRKGFVKYLDSNLTKGTRC